MRFGADINYHGGLPIPDNYKLPVMQMIENYAASKGGKITEIVTTKSETGYKIDAIIEIK